MAETMKDGERPKPTVLAVQLAESRKALAASQEELAALKDEHAAALAATVAAAPTGAKGWGIAAAVVGGLGMVAAPLLAMFGVTLFGFPAAVVVGGVASVVAGVLGMVAGGKFDGKALGELLVSFAAAMKASKDSTTKGGG